MSVGNIIMLLYAYAETLIVPHAILSCSFFYHPHAVFFFKLCAVREHKKTLCSDAILFFYNPSSAFHYNVDILLYDKRVLPERHRCDIDFFYSLFMSVLVSVRLSVSLSLSRLPRVYILFDDRLSSIIYDDNKIMKCGRYVAGA